MDDLHYVGSDTGDGFYERLQKGAVGGMPHERAERLIYEKGIPFRVVKEEWSDGGDVDLPVRVIVVATFFRDADPGDYYHPPAFEGAK